MLAPPTKLLILGACLALAACGPAPSPQTTAAADANQPRVAQSAVEGTLVVQMLDSGVGTDGISRGGNLFLIEDSDTVYQLIKTDDTQYTNLREIDESIEWQLGLRYRFVGSVHQSLPEKYAGTPQLEPSSGKSLAFVVASEVILLDKNPAIP